MGEITLENLLECPYIRNQSALSKLSESNPPLTRWLAKRFPEIEPIIRSHHRDIWHNISQNPLERTQETDHHTNEYLWHISNMTEGALTIEEEDEFAAKFEEQTLADIAEDGMIIEWPWPSKWDIELTKKENNGSIFTHFIYFFFCQSGFVIHFELFALLIRLYLNQFLLYI